MTMVKGLYDQTLNLDHYEPKHLGLLLERVTKRMRHDIALLDGAGDLRRRHEPLTSAYYRLLALIPVAGGRITDLAVPAGMTKQALGQFVDVLVEHGYVTVHRTEQDRRSRIVRRTEKGDALVTEIEELYEKLHERWRAAVGAQRWQQFHETLVELSVGWQDDPK